MTDDFKRNTIRRLSVDLAIPEKDILSVINWQFSSTEEALKKHSSVELSGIGVFIFSPNNAKRALRKCYNYINAYERELSSGEVSPKRETSLRLGIEVQKRFIEMINTRMHEHPVDENL